MGEPRRGWILTVLVCALIVGGGAVLTWIIFTTEPKAVREGATKKTAMLVDVVPAENGTFRPTITAMGTVRPSKEIVLRPRVGGEVLEIGEAFAPGGIVKKKELLVRLDPADYRNTLRRRKSELQQAEATLRIEMGRQNVAEKEYELFGEELSGSSNELVLRKPQLQQAQAGVEAARAAYELAELELERTRIRAPFDAHVLTREVNVGSQVGAGERLGILVGVHTYWVEAMVPLSQLRWLPAPDASDDPKQTVQVRNRTAWPEDVHRTGSIYRVVGELEEGSRMARVLVAVEEPLARDEPGSPPLMINAYVELRFTCRPLSNVVRLERDLLRDQDTVWVMEEGKLAIRDVNVVFKDPTYAYIDEGLNEGDRIVTTDLVTVADGAALRLKKGTE